jgi:hypothetical protein
LHYNLIGITTKRQRYPIEVSWAQISGTLVVLQRNLNLSAFHHAKEVEQKPTIERNPQGLTAVGSIY